MGSAAVSFRRRSPAEFVVGGFYFHAMASPRQLHAAHRARLTIKWLGSRCVEIYPLAVLAERTAAERLITLRAT